MDIYYMIVLFIFGTILGSFYNVVGDRLPEGKSIVKPSSHCPKCGHKLTPLELIPIFSYLIQKGRCKGCNTKIPIMHPLFEFISGLLFMLAYISFKLSPELLIALTFISILLIIFISDIEYMIIPDEVLIVGIILLVIEKFCIHGLKPLLISLLDGTICFILMYLLKKFGDFLFKKESMGGGDIKLMFIFGFVLGTPMAIMSIFIGSIIGLPISLIVLSKNASHEIPFGPLLSLGALIILLTKFNFDKFLGLFS